MHRRLEIYTLGGLAVHLDGQPVAGFDTRKVPALLVYLACTERPHPREVLAEMLWEERPQAQALANLRVALSSLRQTVGDFVEITRDTVSLCRDKSVWLDVADTEQRLLEVERLAVGGILSPQGLELLESVRALYRGDFLEGFHLASQSFNEWALLERERLRFGIIYALDRLTEEYTRQQNIRAGLDCIARLMQIDPLREKTYRQAMRLLATSGQREAALLQYDACQRILYDQLGISPEPDTVTLYEHIRAGHLHAPLPQTGLLTLPTNHKLPVQATSFIGRQTEIHDLLNQLNNPDCRLITITGPGGIGKTRLALEVARQAQNHFADGVCFIPLGPVHTRAAIVPALLGALAIPVPDNASDLQAVLLGALGQTALLLVLDNLEHLLDHLDLWQAILTDAPQVKLLVTSRQPLGLTWEWCFVLHGMAVPASLGEAGPETYSGIRLFVERARRAQQSFSLTDDPAGVIRICQLVEGMPLGIELAAAWLRFMPCSAILEQLVELETPHHPVEARHRSLRALFENTWQRLTAHEQTLLMRLSVFHGGFDVASAQAVAGAALPQLAALVNKSLISVNFHSSRYDIHRLMNQFLRDKLASDPIQEQQALDAHSRYFLDFLQAREAALRSDPHALPGIQADIDNVRAAWRQAVERRRFDWIARGCSGLNTFCMLKVLHHEALATFQETLALLLAEPETPDRDRAELALQSCLMTPLTAVYGWENHRLWPVAERIRALAQRLGDDQQTLASLIMLINLYINEEWERAIVAGQEAVALSLQMGPQAQMAAYTANEIALIFTGRLSSALHHARAAQARFDPEDCLWAMAIYGGDPLVMSLSHSGWTLCLLGFAEQGFRDLDAALARAEQLAQPFAQAFAWAFVALSALCTRETGKTRSAAQVLAELSAEHGFGHWLVFAPCFLGVALIQQGDYDEGIARLQPAIQSEIDAGLTHNLPSWYAHLGYAFAMMGHLEQGLSELERGIAVMERVGERLHESLIYRFQGELRRMSGDEAGAEAWFERAILVAQQQHAKFYELRATMSLCRLWQQQDRPDEARERLAAICGWFTEGLDRPDLVEARALLDELA